MSDRPVRVGLQLPPYGVGLATLMAGALAAEELGVDVPFTWDHFLPPARTVLLAGRSGPQCHPGPGARRGDPDDVGPPLRGLGASLFVLVAGGPGFDLGALRRWLLWRGRENA